MLLNFLLLGNEKLNEWGCLGLSLSLISDKYTKIGVAFHCCFENKCSLVRILSNFLAVGIDIKIEAIFLYKKFIVMEEYYHFFGVTRNYTESKLDLIEKRKGDDLHIAKSNLHFGKFICILLKLKFHKH